MSLAIVVEAYNITFKKDQLEDTSTKVGVGVYIVGFGLTFSLNQSLWEASKDSRLEACGVTAKLYGNNHTKHQKYFWFPKPIR